MTRLLFSGTILGEGFQFDHENTEIVSENIFNNDDGNYAYTVIMRKNA
jgi:hypothetical protein